MNLDILKFKLQQALQNNTAKRRKLATSGRIEPSRLAHYKTSENLYSQPIPNTGKEYKCDIILDVSGSMFNYGRIWNAVQSAQNLVKLFHGIIDFRIIAFGRCFYQLSTNELLSITKEKVSSWELFRKHLDRDVGTNITANGTYGYIIIEGGHTNVAGATWGPAPLAHSLNSMKSQSGERFVVFITDGMDDVGLCASEVNGISVEKYNPVTYPKLLKEFKDEGINILPIGISIDIRHNFSEAVNVNNPDEIYEKTINFIQDKFNN